MDRGHPQDIPSDSTGTLSYAPGGAFCEDVASGRENECVRVGLYQLLQ